LFVPDEGNARGGAKWGLLRAPAVKNTKNKKKATRFSYHHFGKAFFRFHFLFKSSKTTTDDKQKATESDPQ